ncbi:MAG: hypothetical protein FJZ64_04655, partial [Chlamydiae bacterium]|nr:hypothetical protein [Chlamydiota bacterium]
MELQDKSSAESNEGKNETGVQGISFAQTGELSIQENQSPLAPLLISIKDEPSFAISTSYLFWAAREDGLKVAGANYFYVGADKSVNPPRIAQATQGTDFYPSWNTGSGFKVGVTGKTFHDDWNLSSEYTWISNGNSQSSDAWPGNYGVGPTGATGISVWETDPNSVSDIL